MARIRTIKPEFFTSADIEDLTPLSRLFYAFLWTESDRDGRLEYRPRNWKNRFFPGDDKDIESLSQELEEQGLFAVFEVDGTTYAYLPNFVRHQVINNRESESCLPEPPRVKDAFTRVKAEGRKEGKGREGKEGRSELDEEPGVKRANGVPYQKIAELWAEMLPELPQPVKLTDARKAQIRARWNDELPDLDAWRECFALVRASPFLMGKVAPRNGYKRMFCTLDFITKQANVVKLYEGYYDGKA